jgi:hypothetical protein
MSNLSEGLIVILTTICSGKSEEETGNEHESSIEDRYGEIQSQEVK